MVVSVKDDAEFSAREMAPDHDAHRSVFASATDLRLHCDTLPLLPYSSAALVSESYHKTFTEPCRTNPAAVQASYRLEVGRFGWLFWCVLLKILLCRSKRHIRP